MTEKLVGDTLSIEVLIQSLSEYMEARQEHDRARDEYSEAGGHSWGYHGYSYVKAYEGAAERFKNDLMKVIDERVGTILAEKMK